MKAEATGGNLAVIFSILASNWTGCEVNVGLPGAFPGKAEIIG